MAHRLYAVDLGAWSVKVVVAQPGLRSATITHVVERMVPFGDGTHEERAFGVVAQIVRELHLEHDTPYLGVFGDQVFTHVLEFGFKNTRRAELAKAVGSELEGVVPVDLEDMVYAFEPLPPPAVVPIEPGAMVRGRVAAPADGMRVLTYAMRKQRAEELIRMAANAGAEPRGLVAAGGAAVRLVERVPSLAPARAAGPVAVVDIGHERTDVVVVRANRAVFSRTIARGGRHVTEAIARHWRLAFPDAERAKHTDGFIASTAEPATSEQWVKIHDALIGEVGPMVRELRQTFAGCRARTGETVGAVLLVGGGARLRGLASFVAEQLGVPAFVVGQADITTLAGPRLQQPQNIDSAALTIGLAHDAATGRPQFDLRTGDLAFKVDLSFLRAKAVPLAAAALVIVAFAGIAAYASLYSLKSAEKTLAARVEKESNDFFKKKMSAEEVIKSQQGAASKVSPMPKMSAYDLLLEINSKLPPRDKVTLDVTKLEIGEGGRILIEGSTKTKEEIALVHTELAKIECLGGKDNITRGDTETGPKGEQKFKFSVTKSTCM